MNYKLRNVIVLGGTAMSDNKEYVAQTLENGSIFIGEEVIASIAAMAAQDVDGVYGLGGAGSHRLKSHHRQKSQHEYLW